MRGNLFGSLLNGILNESLGEVIVNPNDTSQDVFEYRLVDLSDDSRNPEPVIMVYPKISDEDTIRLKDNPETKGLLNRRNKLAAFPIHPETLSNPNSNQDEYNVILQICQAVNSLGNYGKINPNDIIDDARAHYERESSLNVKDVKKSESDLWDEFLDNFDTPRVQMLLASIEKFAGLEGKDGLDWTYSRNNMMKILSQDSKRIAAGKQPATFVAKPQDWRIFNRQIKRDAIPFWLIYKKDPGTIDVDTLADTMQQNGVQNVTRDNALDIHNAMGKDYKTLATHRANKFTTYNKMDANGQTLPRGFGWGDYYDVSDTEVIPGLEDKFTKEDRQGFLDNIRLIPTEASREKFGDLGNEENDYEKTKKEINQLLGVNEDDIEYQKNLDYTYASLYYMVNSANILNLASVNWNDVVNKLSTEEKKKQIFNMIMIEATPQIRGENAKDGFIKSKAQAVGCLYVCSHRIAPVYGMSQFRKFKESAKFLDQVKEPVTIKNKQRQVLYDYKNIYKKVCDKIENNKEQIIPYIDKVFQQKQQQQDQTATGVALEESVSNLAKMWVGVFKQFDNFLQKLGVDKDGNDLTDFNISPETQQLSEAKFYNLLNRIKKTGI